MNKSLIKEALDILSEAKTDGPYNSKSFWRVINSPRKMSVRGNSISKLITYIEENGNEFSYADMKWIISYGHNQIFDALVSSPSVNSVELKKAFKSWMSIYFYSGQVGADSNKKIKDLTLFLQNGANPNNLLTQAVRVYKVDKKLNQDLIALALKFGADPEARPVMNSNDIPKGINTIADLAHKYNVKI